MDKNTIIGFGLIGALLVGFMFFNKPDEKDKPKEASTTPTEQLVSDTNSLHTAVLDTNKVDQGQPISTDTVAKDHFAAAIMADSLTAQIGADTLVQAEQLVTLENDKLVVTFSTKGGRMVQAQLKGYKKGYENADKTIDSLFLFQNNEISTELLLTTNQNSVVKTNELVFTPIQTKDSLIMRYSYSEDQYIDFVYKLSKDDYMMKYDINIVGMQKLLNKQNYDVLAMRWVQNLRRQEKNFKTEETHSHIYYKNQGSSVEQLAADKNEVVEVKQPMKWIAFKDQFFATILIADDKLDIAQLDSRVTQTDEYLKYYEATIYAPATIDPVNQKIHAGFSYFMGPLSFTHLKAYDDTVSNDTDKLTLDELVPLGWSLFRVVNKYFVIPLFNVLKSTGMSIGLVILLLTVAVKLIISPLTYKSFMSSAKMRVLRPQVELLNEKYPKQEQATEKQQATMKLYNSAGVNPMSGCIPMLLQMPILIALFQFFPNAIDLRQHSFLWATDLSTYDAVITWGTKLPLIGNHLSLFCVLMTITNIIYAKFNMEATNTGQAQMPGMKWMMYLMPVAFFFMLNDFPSGLTYYYFLSLLITIILTLVFRYTINEEKVLAKLEANKSKPKKKSGFMARLEEAQRLQQQNARQDSKKKLKKK